MIATACGNPVSLSTLLEYWLGELEPARESAVDLHLLGCGPCSTLLESLVDIAGGVRAVVRKGAVHAALSDAFVKRLGAGGLRLREYRVPHNGSVLCTVAPEDDLLIARLDAPLAGVERLDVEHLREGGADFERLRDVPFDAGAGEVILAPRMERIRALPETTTRIRLLAMASAGGHPAGERLVGEYTFHHRPGRREGGRR